MFLTLFICVAVIRFSPAFSETSNVIRSKHSDDYIPCERGWYYFHEKCYRAFARKPSERISWDRALEKCKQNGGDLVSIHSQEEQDFLVTFLQFDVKWWVWIGLHNHDEKSYYRWSDGSPFDYINWKPGEPSGVGGAGDQENCIHMVYETNNEYLGKWNDRACDAVSPYICEMNADIRKRSPNPMYCSSHEGGGWKFQSSCYHVVTEMKSWKNAERYCKTTYNGHLVTVLDTLVDYFLDYILANKSEEMWIGVKIKEELQQKWTSGWFVSYDGFEKETHFREGTCVARKKRKDWITVPCTKKLSFICEVSKETAPVLKLPERGSHCPKDVDYWRDLEGEYCYYIETKKSLNFYEALFDCQTRGGNMVSLHSKEERDILYPFIKHVQHAIYIGLVRTFARPDEFAWTDGSAYNYENWMANQPDNEEEKCVEADVHWNPYGMKFVWNDIRCDQRRSYICSVKKITPIPNFEEDNCTSYCIADLSHLHEMVKQSPDAKQLPRSC